jgi:hypothetical protein
MAIQNHDLAWFAVLTLGIVLVLNSVVVMILFFQIARRLGAAQAHLVTLGTKTQNATAALRQALSHLDGLPEKLSRAGGRAPQLLEPLNGALRRFDTSAASAIVRLKARLRQFDETADRVLSNLSTETFRVHRAIIHPAMRLSGLLQSVTSVFERFKQERAQPPASYSPDEEIFI